MKEIVIKYLTTQYQFMISTYATFKVYERSTKQEVTMISVLKTLPKIFGVEEKEIMVYFDNWADEQSIIINNRVTDYKYAYFQKYGVELPVSELKEDFMGTDCMHS